ncbi:RNA polymerase sigma factor [Parapedobacter koreensis]|uniref:RNA polymerase sigma-70 factor, ECF subfamily n=1 Tax=Parapedobacter koreensis TaxID=332977 RepID=A0A1H7FZB9_9SPHI|nr:sigma-70 family RNA polymerase sigma factor [Parapedobacter koreensis]SEK28765.1 RNA polymerase sigma-70 factor, ECF subfamily [Parapedobacter koreensis]
MTAITKNTFTELEEVAEMANGNINAFNQLYERYHRRVYTNILKMVKIPEYAEEILQDVFVSLWQNRFNMRTGQSVGGWLFVVSFNKSLTFLKRRLKESIEFVAAYPFEIAEQDDTAMEETYRLQMDLLEEAVDGLPKRKREVFKLCRYEGKSKEAVAEQLGISPKSVKDYLKQSNKAIKEYISMHYPYAGEASLLLIWLCM